MDHTSLLDEMISGDSVEILKAALPYLPARGQSFASIFAKFLELQNTIRLFHDPDGGVQLRAQSSARSNPLEMLTACSKACRGRQKEQLDNIVNTLVMLQMLELSQKSPSKEETEKGEESPYESSL